MSITDLLQTLTLIYLFIVLVEHQALIKSQAYWANHITDAMVKMNKTINTFNNTMEGTNNDKH